MRGKFNNLESLDKIKCSQIGKKSNILLKIIIVSPFLAHPFHLASN